jgi:hypothetical protein
MFIESMMATAESKCAGSRGQIGSTTGSLRVAVAVSALNVFAIFLYHLHYPTSMDLS